MSFVSRLVLASYLMASGFALGGLALADSPPNDGALRVSGVGTDLANSALVHSDVKTAGGEVQRSTEIIELAGDLKGKVLYHVTTQIDAKKNVLTNTGDEVFSGTVLGSAPVLIHNSKFHFQVDLASGKDSGTAVFDDPIAGPRIRCRVSAEGTGKDAAGNPTFKYTGLCRFGK